MSLTTLEDFEHPHLENQGGEDLNIFSFVPFFTNVSSVALSSLLIVTLALIFPWKGGSVSWWFGLLYYFTMAVSFYTFVRGYIAVYRRGLMGWDFLFWCGAVLVTILPARRAQSEHPRNQKPLIRLGRFFFFAPVPMLQQVSDSQDIREYDGSVCPQHPV